jgi:hypothetical protein
MTDNILELKKKVCAKCKMMKPIDEFHKNKRLTDGRKIICKKCISLRKKELKIIKLQKAGIARFKNKEGDLPVIKDFWDEVKNKIGGFTGCLPAISGSGKSTLLTHMMKQIRKHFDLICIVSQNANADIYEHKVWDIRIHRRNMDKFLKQIRRFQVKTKRKLKVVVVLDDVTNKNTKANNIILDLVLNGRNQNISTLLSSQSDKLISKDERKNFHFAIILRQLQPESQIATIETFMLRFIKTPPGLTKDQKFDWLENYLLVHTKNYGCLFLNYRAKNEDDRIKIIKAKLPL